MKKKLLIALPLASVIVFSGCATILGGGTSQTVSISSNKPAKGVLKYSDGKGTQYFTAPATLTVDRRSKDIVLTSEEGNFQSTTVKSRLNPWFLGNIIFGGSGLISSTTDSVGGAMWKYDDNVAITLNTVTRKHDNNVSLSPNTVNTVTRKNDDNVAISPDTVTKKNDDNVAIPSDQW